MRKIRNIKVEEIIVYEKPDKFNIHLAEKVNHDEFGLHLSEEERRDWIRFGKGMQK
jgi:hypothetical protein